MRVAGVIWDYNFWDTHNIRTERSTFPFKTHFREWTKTYNLVSLCTISWHYWNCRCGMQWKAGQTETKNDAAFWHFNGSLGGGQKSRNLDDILVCKYHSDIFMSSLWGVFLLTCLVLQILFTPKDRFDISTSLLREHSSKIPTLM